MSPREWYKDIHQGVVYMIEPRILKGFRDAMPDQEIVRRRLMQRLETTFQNFGFVPIDTPALEYTEVLLGKGGGETDKQIYHFLDNGGRDIALRFDLTIPFARFTAAHLPELSLPFKRYHIAKVWRGENTQRGRYREFFQCDFDIVGTDCAAADFEVLLLMYESFRALDIDRFTFSISHRGIFNRFLAKEGLRERSEEILRTVDKLKKIGELEVLGLLTSLSDERTARRILDYITPGSSFDETLHTIEAFAGGPAEDSERLRALHRLMIDMGIEDCFILDPSITRGLDYYTGIVFETFLTDLPGIGSVCSGGRYNDLASLYTKERLPGVGSSIGLDRLMAALEELQTSNIAPTTSQVLIMNLDEQDISAYFKISRSLRNAGIASEVFLQKKKMALQFKHAERKGIRFALFLGRDDDGMIRSNLKDLQDQQEWKEIELDSIVDLVRDRTRG